MTQFQCERFGDVRTFDSIAECQRFVRREGNQSRCWSYLGEAQAIYEASIADDIASHRRALGLPATDWFGVARDILTTPRQVV